MQNESLLAGYGRTTGTQVATLWRALIKLNLPREAVMRVLIILVAVVLVMALVGWISFNREDGRASVNIETQEIREDTESAMEAGSDLLHKAADDVDPDNTDVDQGTSEVEETPREPAQTN